MPVSGTFINFGGTRLSTMERPCAFSYRAPKQKLEHAVGDAEKRLEIILFFFSFFVIKDSIPRRSSTDGLRAQW